MAGGGTPAPPARRGGLRRPPPPVGFGGKPQAVPDGAEDLLLVHPPRRSHHQVRLAVVRVRVLEDVVAREPRNRLIGAGDAAAEWMIRPHDLLEQVLYIFLGLV